MKHSFTMDPALDTPGDSRLNSTKWNENHVWVAMSEPDDPTENIAITWMSNGYGVGDEGDIMVKINIGGVVKYVTLVDFSEAISTTQDIVFEDTPDAEWADTADAEWDKENP